MSLNLNRLEKVRHLSSGITQARCPACAEGGNDRTGEHLRIYPDGRFGCCVHPKDEEHRRRIFALAGERQAPRQPSRQFKVRVANEPTTAAAAKSIRGSLTGFARTARTGERELAATAPASQEWPELDFRTTRTGNSKSHAYAREETAYIYNKAETGVLSVLSGKVAETTPDTAGKQERMPFLTADGTLSIPFDSPERYHWWKGGQSVEETYAEVVKRMESGKEEHANGI
ncbi:MAG: hypothetical protein WCO56_24455 [Verrucomicrobiota bacterium]